MDGKVAATLDNNLEVIRSSSDKFDALWRKWRKDGLHVGPPAGSIFADALQRVKPNARTKGFFVDALRREGFAVVD